MRTLGLFLLSLWRFPNLVDRAGFRRANKVAAPSGIDFFNGV
jgi:hypothetical protein